MKLDIKKNWHWIGLGVILLIFIGGEIYSFNTELYDTGDNAKMIILAQSILKYGEMRLLNQPDLPRDIDTIPLFPIMLAPVLFLFGLNFAALKIYIIIMSVITVIAVFLFFNQISSRKIAFVITLILSMSYEFVHWTHQIMGDVPFMMFMFLALYFLVSERGYLMILCILFASFIKLNGIMLLPAAIVYLVVKKNYKHAILVLLLTIIPFGLFMFRNREFGQTSYGQLTKYIDPYDPGKGMLDIDTFAVRAASNVFNYMENMITFVFYRHTQFDTRFALFDISLLLLIFFGYFSLIFEKKLLLPVLFTLFMGMMSVWPWQTIRFILPMVPVIFYFLITGLMKIFNLFIKQFTFKLKYVFYCILVLLVLVQVPYYFAALEHGKTYGYGVSQNPELYKYKLMAEWARDNIGDDKLILCRKPYLFYIWSGGKYTKLYPFLSDKAAVVNAIVQADYIVYDEIGSASQMYLAPIIQEMGFLFKPVFHVDKTAIFEIRGEEPAMEENPWVEVGE